MIGWAPSDLAHEHNRFAVRAHRWAVWTGLWIVAAVAEALALRPVLFDRTAPIDGLALVVALVGGSFAACGLVAWRRRPDSRSGALMTATGFAFFVSPLLSQLDAPVAQTLYTLLVDVWIFFFVTLLLTLLTSGRLVHARDRWLVASYALPLVVLQIAWLLFLTGLRGLADRVEALDGHLRVVSPPGGGTVVSAELPCGS